MPSEKSSGVFGVDLTATTFQAFDKYNEEHALYKKPSYAKMDEKVKDAFMRAMATSKIAGAAGEPDPFSDDERYQEMSDPYVADSRRKFESEVFTNQLLSRGLQNRANAFFRKGFHLELEVKSSRDEKGNLLTPEQKDALLKEQTATLQNYLRELETWAYKEDTSVLEKMRSANVVSFVQGRSLTLITPGIEKLQPGKLPDSLKNISWEDTGNPVVDRDLWKRVAVRIQNLAGKEIVMNDECVYLTRKAYGLRKESDFYGASELEGVVQPARIFTKLVNYDMAKAIVAGYLAKVFVKVPMDNLDETSRDTYLSNVASRIVASGVDVLALEDGLEVTIQPVKVDTDMIVRLFDKLSDLLTSATGATKSQMGITDGLTRDNATIQEIVFMKYVRNVDEELVKNAFENQLFTPLLAHLAGKKVEELPVQVIIKSDDEEMEKMEDRRLMQKQEEVQDAEKEQVATEAIKQPDAKENTFGASGHKSLQERDVAARERQALAEERLAKIFEETYGAKK